MIFETCRRPKTGRLAKEAPGKSALYYTGRIETELAYWKSAGDHFFDTNNMAKNLLASEFVYNLDNLCAEGERWRNIPRLGENSSWKRFRRNALGVLAMSQLGKHLLGEVDADTMKELSLTEPYPRNSLPEFPEQINDKTLDGRFHLLPSAADRLLGPAREGIGVTWYQSQDHSLYVRRIDTAQPSEPFAMRLLEEQVHVDFDQLQTLYPYIPADI